MSLKRRIGELERKLAIVRPVRVLWPNPDGTIIMDGVVVTREEHRQRCRAQGIRLIELQWPEQRYAENE